MDTIPHAAPQGKHHTYALAYPENMGGLIFYIGKGFYPNRMYQHNSEARHPENRSRKHHVIRKIWSTGEKVAYKRLADFETHEDALMHEIALIFLMRPYGSLTNITEGGEGAMGHTPTEEHRRKLSEAQKGKPHSEEHTRNASQARKGVPQSEEQRRKMSESRRGLPSPKKGKPGHPLSEAAKRRVSETHKGRPKPEEQRRKMSEAATRRYHPEKGVSSFA